MPCGDKKNPLQRGGTSQKERSLAALNSGYVSVDENDYADWIVFANAFARFLNYFDDTNKKSGDWTPFFTSDISSQLGGVAVQDIDAYRLEIKKRFDFLKDDANRADTVGLEVALNDLFSALLTLSKAIDEYLQKLPDAITLQNTLLNLVQSKLATALYRLLGYYKAAKASPLEYLSEGISASPWRILNKPFQAAAIIIETDKLSSNWWMVLNGSSIVNYEWLRNNKSSVAGADALLASINSWSDYIASIPPDDSIFNSALAASAVTNAEKEYLRIQHAANHNLFSSIFDQYLSGYTKIIADAAKELETTLADWNRHQPHYALFLSFLKLFKYVQQQANTITGRHLDFYYKEVLRLRPKEALPNKAHVLVELAKQVDSYLVQKGTLLKAGKDSLGKEVVYALDNDTTFNKAKVTSLRSVYFAAATDTIKNVTVTPAQEIQKNAGRLFAAPVANSSDGLGAELKTPNKEWHPYINKDFSEGVLTKIAAPEGSIGFAFASHYLALAEGERKVFLKLVTSSNNAMTGKHFDVYFTTAKGWLKLDPDFITINTSSTTAIAATATTPAIPARTCAQIALTLTGDQPAIVNYNAAVHGGSFGVASPVVKLVLQQQDSLLYEYDQLKELTVTAVEIGVDVGEMAVANSKKGVKNLVLSNDAGPLDPSKPFQPFGSQPKKDATFIIGNKEAFSKNNTSLKLNIEWANLPASIEKIKYTAASDSDKTVPEATVDFLAGGVWIGHDTDTTITEKVTLFDSGNKTEVSIGPMAVPDVAVKEYGEDYTALNGSSKKGFLKLVLRDDFGYKAYLDDLTTHLINQSKPGVTAVKFSGIEPYTPAIQSIYLRYSSYQNIVLTSTDKKHFEEREIRFFHLYPFGEAEQHQYINSINGITVDIRLLPQFSHKAGAVAKQHVGEFYIGLDNLQPGSAVNLLFQVLEGTTNPQVAKPENHITWSYLSHNFWIEFASQQVSDATLALLQSGIVSFAIPLNATTDNTLLPAGKIWLRAAVESAVEAVPKMLSVDAQAAVSTFLPQGNAADFLATPLPAGTISKLKAPDAAIKTIVQPYNAFGGRPKETEDHFYLRASERLRHKSRAITIWDYEHLILEAFPEIYKVKCLNHTSVFTHNGTELTNEMQPGHVLLITIPTLTNRNDVNPLQPYTSQDTLTRIEAFIREKVSCFVTVAARHPLFEEIGLSFQLRLYDQYKDFTFYANKLRNEIVEYLTPWAGNSKADIQFGGKVYKSSLINFIEERYYVDFITDVVLSHKVGTTTITDSNLEEITASTARSILVSMPASKHMINPYIPVAQVAAAECAALVQR